MERLGDHVQHRFASWRVRGACLVRIAKDVLEHVEQCGQRRYVDALQPGKRCIAGHIGEENQESDAGLLERLCLGERDDLIECGRQVTEIEARLVVGVVGARRQVGDLLQVLDQLDHRAEVVPRQEGFPGRDVRLETTKRGLEFRRQRGQPAIEDDLAEIGLDAQLEPEPIHPTLQLPEQRRDGLRRDIGGEGIDDGPYRALKVRDGGVGGAGVAEVGDGDVDGVVEQQGRQHFDRSTRFARCESDQTAWRACGIGWQLRKIGENQSRRPIEPEPVGRKASTRDETAAERQSRQRAERRERDGGVALERGDRDR